MIHEAQSETKLRELLAQGSLPASKCGRRFRELIAPLLDGGVLVWQRGGPGKQLVVADPESLVKFIAVIYPQSSDKVDSQLSSRVTAVARYRNSKALSNDVSEVVNLRAWRDGVLRCEGEDVPVSTLTAAHGVFSFLLGDGSRHSLHGSCALVENPAVFTACERLDLPLSLVFFGRGRISERLLDWFIQQDDPTFGILHLPDYDPVGLNEFERIRNRLGERVRLHAPCDLEQRFERFANRSLLDKPNSRAMLAKLRRSNCAEVHRVVELIDRNNAGLEQEALLL